MSRGVMTIFNLIRCKDYWDACGDAGPKSRPAEAFEKETPKLEVLSFDGAKMACLGSIPFGCEVVAQDS